MYSLGFVPLTDSGSLDRDAKRLSDLEQLQVALELYYTDQNQYPSGTGIILGSPLAFCLNAASWQVAMCPNPYMGVVPSDPKGGRYIYTGNKTSYTITATFEGNTIYGLKKGPVVLTPSGIVNKWFFLYYDSYCHPE